jgi:hypothetical protein
MEKVEGIIKHLNKISFRGPLGITVVFLSFAFLFLLAFKIIPSANKDVITFAAGQMLTLAGVVISWYFGSSKEKADAEKTAQVKDLLSGEKSETITTKETPE